MSDRNITSGPGFSVLSAFRQHIWEITRLIFFNELSQRMGLIHKAQLPYIDSLKKPAMTESSSAMNTFSAQPNPKLILSNKGAP